VTGVGAGRWPVAGCPAAALFWYRSAGLKGGSHGWDLAADGVPDLDGARPGPGGSGVFVGWRPGWRRLRAGHHDHPAGGGDRTEFHHLHDGSHVRPHITATNLAPPFNENHSELPIAGHDIGQHRLVAGLEDVQGDDSLRDQDRAQGKHGQGPEHGEAFSRQPGGVRVTQGVVRPGTEPDPGPPGRGGPLPVHHSHRR
jgi:hypothetical protein